MPPAARSFSRRDTVFMGAGVLLSIISLGLPDRQAEPIASALRRTIIAPLVALQHDAEQTRQAWLTREERRLEQDSVALRLMTVEEVRSENDRLRQLLGLGQRLRWGFVPVEVLLARSPGEEYTVILSGGERAGIKPFSAVVAPEGLVGMVKSVDPSMSRAIVWAHPDFRVSAMAADGSAFGIVAAHLGSDPERYLLEMRGVPIRSSLKRGTVIVSSGLGGVFPRGIPIGTVLDSLPTSEVWAKAYLLRPAVLPSDMHSVMVLLQQRASNGVEGVWATGQGVDSAVRSIVSAGDSLARAAEPGGRPAPDSVARPTTTGQATRPPTPFVTPQRPAATPAPAAPATPAGPPASPRPDSSVARNDTAGARP
ncbi:MAG TPA: rod shape-determining protein MreC [Gemmatimonadaceae bacterium]|nr:rod shape-determining protein MreC [Gemmatimonadaceae bacterium]